MLIRLKNPCLISVRVSLGPSRGVPLDALGAFCLHRQYFAKLGLSQVVPWDFFFSSCFTSVLYVRHIFCVQAPPGGLVRLNFALLSPGSLSPLLAPFLWDGLVVLCFPFVVDGPVALLASS